MLVDELKEQLKNLESDVSILQQFYTQAKLEQEFLSLEHMTKQEDFWKQENQATILKQLQSTRIRREQFNTLTKTYSTMIELVDLLAHEPAELKDLALEISALARDIKAFKISLLLSDARDTRHCYVYINAGAGGTEAQDWAEILLRMYLRFCEKNRLQTTILDQQSGETAGIKSAVLFIKGVNAYGILKSEHGVHRLVRISPYDSSKRRHTSFASVTVTPEAPHINIQINPSDLRIDTFRSGGAGGQHVNKTESAVRITHLPTGIVTQCQNERSQAQNKEAALKILHAKLAQKMEEEQEQALTKGVEKKKIEWGSQIRSYVLHPYKMVKDHRTDYESARPELILDGELIDFVEQFLLWHQTQQ
jgi:peptide chain release factor 2